MASELQETYDITPTIAFSMPALVHPWQYWPQENIHHETMVVVKLTVCRVCGR